MFAYMGAFIVLVLSLLAIYLLVRTRAIGKPAGRQFFAQIHGITHKNDDGSSRQAIIKTCHEGEELVLVPEPTNRFDCGAVKICRKNGEQLGYWQAGRMAGDLAAGWTYRVTIDEIYPFKENRRNHGVRLLVEVLSMSRVTEARKLKREAKNAAPLKR